MARPDFRSPRLYLPVPLAAGTAVALPPDQANYLLNVLRLGAGARVLAFNGADGEWGTELQISGKRAASLSVAEQLREQPAVRSLAYAFAPLKHARLDYMVQKAVEMGASDLQPVLTHRTQATRVNLDRMRANAIEAAEQCGVLAVPAVHAEQRFEAWLAAWPADALLVFCDEDAETADPVRALSGAGFDPLQPGRLGLVIGPEGGFDESERRALLALPRVVRLSLGPRILRADTAAVAALALIQAALGDWR